VLLLIFIYVKTREGVLKKEKSILEKKVAERTAEVVNMNKELAEKNKELVDSILYASRIQNALFPPDLPFDQTFVFFLPKDIVSGDFFWYTQNNSCEWMAAVDCTGHGVPGAFMSIIGHNLLDKIVNEMKITRPSDILNKLNDEVSWTLHQYHYDNQIHDGMDLSLVCYDPSRHLLSYSGAFNPLWIIRDGALLETRGNRYSIGMAPGMTKDFINHEILLMPGDTVYLFSDGLADQFGGPFNKKLKISAFKELIIYLQKFPMSEQKKQLKMFYESWKGENHQVDDILVIGRRFDF
jgi:serine phosphatase RsbU (regulator of sigma subunit)